MLQCHRFEDWFTLELAWSDAGRWPANAPIPASPEDRPPSGELRFRAGYLWKENNRDVWWQFAPRQDIHSTLAQDIPVAELLPKVDVLVDDALNHVRDDVIPYFDRLASER